MSLKQVLIVVLVVAVAGATALVLFRGKSGQVPGGGGEGAPIGSTRSNAPTNVVVPEKDSENIPKNVAVPVAVGPAGPNTAANFRSFNIIAKGGSFSPDTVIVRQKDTVHLNITAADRDYDFTQPDYGFKVMIPKGETKPIEFGATAPGKFSFYCSVCGGPAGGPVGYLIVSVE